MDNSTNFTTKRVEEGVIVLSGVMLLVLCALGLVGNAVTIWIFTRPSMRSPINLLLCGLAVMDTILLILAVPNLGLYSLSMSNTYGLPGFLFFYFKSIRFIYPPMMMAQTASNWTFVLISFERFVAVCRPFQASVWATKKHAKCSLLIVSILAFLYNIVRFLEVTTNAEGRLEPLLRANKHYIRYYYTGLYLVTHFLVPFTILLVLNLRIVCGLRQDKMLKHCSEAVSGGDCGMTAGQKKNRKQRTSTTRMILGVTGVFAFCNAFPFVLNIWEAVGGAGIFQDPETGIFAIHLFGISNNLIVFNSASSFLVYLIFSTKYRAYFMHLVFQRKLPERQAILSRLEDPETTPIY